MVRCSHSPIPAPLTCGSPFLKNKICAQTHSGVNRALWGRGGGANLAAGKRFQGLCGRTDAASITPITSHYAPMSTIMFSWWCCWGLACKGVLNNNLRLRNVFHRKGNSKY